MENDTPFLRNRRDFQKESIGGGRGGGVILIPLILYKVPLKASRYRLLCYTQQKNTLSVLTFFPGPPPFFMKSADVDRIAADACSNTVRFRKSIIHILSKSESSNLTYNLVSSPPWNLTFN